MKKSDLRQVDLKSLNEAKLRRRFATDNLQDRQRVFQTAFKVNEDFQQHAKDHWCVEGARHFEAPVKRVDRCYQKVNRSYGGNFLRLLDVVRTTIVYPNVASLLKGAEAIVTDEAVRILKGDLQIVWEEGARDYFRKMTLCVLA